MIFLMTGRATIGYISHLHMNPPSLLRVFTVVFAALALLLTSAGFGTLQAAPLIYVAVADITEDPENPPQPGQILAIDHTGAVSVFATGLDRPEGLAIDHQGRLLVLDDGKVIRYDQSGAPTELINLGFYGRSIAVDASGKIYVHGDADLEIYLHQYSTNGVFESAWNAITTNSLAFGPDGSLYASDWNDNRIVRYTSSTTYETAATLGDFVPLGLAIDPAGNLYVSSYDDPTFEIEAAAVRKYSSAGVLLQTLSDEELIFPWGMAYGPNGLLYVNDWGCACGETGIALFNADGTLLTKLPLSDTQVPMGIVVVETIPEPSAIAALLFGGALLAFKLRRKPTARA